MPQLSRDPNAYIRPSPSSGTLGTSSVTRVTIVFSESNELI